MSFVENENEVHALSEKSEPQEDQKDNDSSLKFIARECRRFSSKDLSSVVVPLDDCFVISTNSTIQIVDYTTKNILGEIPLDNKEMKITNIMNWNEEEGLFLIGFDDGNIRSWSILSGQVLQTLHKCKKSVHVLRKLSSHDFCSVSGSDEDVEIIIHSFPYHTIVRTLENERIDENVIVEKSKCYRYSLFLVCIEEIKLLDFMVPQKASKVFPYRNVISFETISRSGKYVTEEIMIIGQKFFRKIVLHIVQRDEIFKEIRISEAIFSTLTLSNEFSNFPLLFFGMKNKIGCYSIDDDKMITINEERIHDNRITNMFCIQSSHEDKCFELITVSLDRTIKLIELFPHSKKYYFLEEVEEEVEEEKSSESNSSTLKKRKIYFPSHLSKGAEHPSNFRKLLKDLIHRQREEFIERQKKESEERMEMEKTRVTQLCEIYEERFKLWREEDFKKFYVIRQKRKTADHERVLLEKKRLEIEVDLRNTEEEELVEYEFQKICMQIKYARMEREEKRRIGLEKYRLDVLREYYEGDEKKFHHTVAHQMVEERNQEQKENVERIEKQKQIELDKIMEEEFERKRKEEEERMKIEEEEMEILRLRQQAFEVRKEEEVVKTAIEEKRKEDEQKLKEQEIRRKEEERREMERKEKERILMMIEEMKIISKQKVKQEKLKVENEIKRRRKEADYFLDHLYHRYELKWKRFKKAQRRKQKRLERRRRIAEKKAQRVPQIMFNVYELDDVDDEANMSPRQRSKKNACRKFRPNSIRYRVHMSRSSLNASPSSPRTPRLKDFTSDDSIPETSPTIRRGRGSDIKNNNIRRRRNGNGYMNLTEKMAFRIDRISKKNRILAEIEKEMKGEVYDPTPSPSRRRRKKKMSSPKRSLTDLTESLKAKQRKKFDDPDSIGRFELYTRLQILGVIGKDY